ncbi:hypothetical protein QR98_0062340 [Sarcoptes scabiei]|uniref:Uncharacterized protein n=1 Tax=Sarcoptes scabiei TaxID=52283 RepID=A0A132A9U0_SARSC|nr:hypothetical protein QR98_0062340 [Sarcoptes scabiei]
MSLWVNNIAEFRTSPFVPKIFHLGRMIQEIIFEKNSYPITSLLFRSHRNSQLRAYEREQETITLTKK